MKDPFAPNSNSSMLRDAQIGLLLVATLLCVFVYVAYYRITGKGRQLPEHVRMAPVAQAVWPNSQPPAPPTPATKRNWSRAPELATFQPSPARRPLRSTPMNRSARPTDALVAKVAFNEPAPDAPAITPIEKIELASVVAPPSTLRTDRDFQTNRTSTRRDHNDSGGKGDHNGLSLAATRKLVATPNPHTNAYMTRIKSDQFKPLIASKPAPTGEPPVALKLNPEPMVKPAAKRSPKRSPQATPGHVSTASSHIQTTPALKLNPARVASRQLPLSPAPLTKAAPLTLPATKQIAALPPNPTSNHKPKHKSSQPPRATFFPATKIKRERKPVPNSNDAFQPATNTGQFSGQQDIARTAPPRTPAEPRIVARPKPMRTPAPNDMTASNDMAASHSVLHHTTQKDDSFWSLASQHYGDGRYFHALFEWNQAAVQNFDELPVGTRIAIPKVRDLQKRYPNVCPPEQTPRSSDSLKPQTIADAEHSISERLYTTQSGDTLFGIAAQKLGQASRYLEIMAINDQRLPAEISQGSPLKPGLKLVLPE